MVRVPIDIDPHRRAWQQLMHHVGLDENTPTPRQVVGIGAGPAKSGHEPNWPVRPPPPPLHQRSERPAPPRSWRWR
jgi:hypothetical protein